MFAVVYSACGRIFVALPFMNSAPAVPIDGTAWMAAIVTGFSAGGSGLFAHDCPVAAKPRSVNVESGTAQVASAEVAPSGSKFPPRLHIAQPILASLFARAQAALLWPTRCSKLTAQACRRFSPAPCCASRFARSSTERAPCTSSVRT